jgi:hypothetical protein
MPEVRFLKRLCSLLGVLPGCSSQAARPLPGWRADEGRVLGEVGVKLAGLLKARGVDTASLRVLAKRGPAEIHVLTVHGSEAIALWRRLHALAGETGCWPVLLGSEQEPAFGIASDSLGDPGALPPAEIIQEGLKIEPAAWLKARAAEDPESYEVEEEDWPEDAGEQAEFTIPCDILTKKPHERVLLALVPASVSWEVPAYLNFGGWNDCPEPPVHVAFLKRWHEAWGAEVVGIAGDVVEMEVARPPKDRAAALALAREQFLYCADIVHQGVGSLEALGAILLGGKVWYFWWD